MSAIGPAWIEDSELNSLPSWIKDQVIHADGGASLTNPEVPPEIQLG